MKASSQHRGHRGRHQRIHDVDVAPDPAARASRPSRRCPGRPRLATHAPRPALARRPPHALRSPPPPERASRQRLVRSSSGPEFGSVAIPVRTPPKPWPIVQTTTDSAAATLSAARRIRSGMNTAVAITVSTPASARLSSRHDAQADSHRAIGLGQPSRLTSAHLGDRAPDRVRRGGGLPEADHRQATPEQQPQRLRSRPGA